MSSSLTPHERNVLASLVANNEGWEALKKIMFEAVIKFRSNLCTASPLIPKDVLNHHSLYVAAAAFYDDVLKTVAEAITSPEQQPNVYPDTTEQILQ